MDSPLPTIQRCPSPNHAPRSYPISYIILHGTWMADDQAALDRLCDEQAEVSCHYYIMPDGELYQLVDDEKVAWHAGKSVWGELTSLNQHSIGIEISNPGEDTQTPYAEAQYKTLEKLLTHLMGKHHIPKAHVIGHSDIATDRKNDPGKFFDWQRLEAAGLAAPWVGTEGEPLEVLKKYGYHGTDTDIVTAFQRRYLPKHVTGELCAITKSFIATGRRPEVYS